MKNYQVSYKIKPATIISIIMAVLIGFGIMGCAKGPVPTPEPEPYKYITDSSGNIVNLVSAGVSDYSVVIPQDASYYESYAAEELVFFVNNSAKTKLPVIADTGLSYDVSKKYISIGNTTVFSGSGIDVSSNEYGNDGLMIATKGNQILLNGGGGYGTLNAVYEFLKQHIAFEAYAVDEIYYRESITIPALNLNLSDIPDIAVRMAGFLSTRTGDTAKAAARLRLLANYLGGITIENKPRMNTWVHSMFTFLPETTYKKDHDDWYNNGQLALGKPALRDEFAKNLIKMVDDNPEIDTYILGPMDNYSSSTAEECLASDAVNGGPGGTLMVFVNDMADRVTKHLADTNQNRTVTLVTQAYHAYGNSPTTYDAKTNTYIPVNNDVIARSNVAVLFAPVHSDMRHALNDPSSEKNKPYYDSIMGWSAITDTMFIYQYDTDYTDHMRYFNNWHAYGENYKFYKELGVEFVFPLGNMRNYSSPFQELRTYLHSKLQWDTSLEVRPLINDFISHYYKAAGAQVQEFFDKIEAHYVYLETLGYEYEHVYDYVDGKYAYSKKDLWPKTFLDSAADTLAKGYEAIDKSSYPEAEKAKLRTRVLAEEVNIIYYQLNFYGEYYDDITYNGLIDYLTEAFARLRITNFAHELNEVITLTKR